MPVVMRSMELSDNEKIDRYSASPVAEKPKGPDYPYGLCISLDEASLEKLDIDPKELVLGGIVHIHALARITSMSTNENESSSTCRAELQIEDMAIESEDAENEDDGD